MNRKILKVSESISELVRDRVTMIDYLLLKVRNEDWHGVQDAASDLRDIDSELQGLRASSK